MIYNDIVGADEDVRFDFFAQKKESLWLGPWLIQSAQVVPVPPLLELPWTSVAPPRSGWDWARTV